MEPSSDPGTEPVLGDGHYTVVLAGAGPDFRAGPFIVSYLCGPDNDAATGLRPHHRRRRRPLRAGGHLGLSSMRPAVPSTRGSRGCLRWMLGPERGWEPSLSTARYDTRQTTLAARQAFARRFEREVDPDGLLPAPERARRAEAAKRAYFQRMALRSAKARRKKATG